MGERAIVAARSVVTRDVPPDTIVAGNPARVVRTLTPAESADRAVYIGELDSHDEAVSIG